MNKKYTVLFSPDFKYKVNFFNLYIIGNYVKRTIGEVYSANGPLQQDHGQTMVDHGLTMVDHGH